MTKSTARQRLSWSVTVAIDDVPEDGKHFELTAPADAGSEIAAVAGLRFLQDLRAVFDVTRRGEGLHVAGHVRANVGQTCVVTLEPLESKLDETVDLTFSPSVAEEADVAVSSGGTEPPEPMPGGVIDLAAVAVEFLLLGVDPYPRKEGVSFGTATAGNPAIEPRPNPFAALAVLKNGDGGNG